MSAETWAAYLEMVAEHGTVRLCAKRLGIPWKEVARRLSEEGEFREAVEHAKEVCAERLEEMLTAPGIDKRQVIGLIVRLKALKPAQYIERQVSMAVNVSTEMQVTPEEARALLANLLKDAQPQTVRMLTGGTA